MVQSIAAPRMPSCLQAFGRNLPLHHSKKARYILSCKATYGPVDRRDVLLSLLGGAAAAGVPGDGQRGAREGPIQSPEMGNCRHPIDNVEVPAGINCCPTYDANIQIIDFKLPPRCSPLRERPAAHLVDREYLAKYERAVALMKELPADDPRSFTQQAHVHCAYCDAAYDQIGFPDLQLQIHGCWLFFPWHRLYLYFYERILGKLIGDDTFALPFWNWDHPAGMALPAMYANSFSPLYDMKRNPDHQPPFPLDLNYNIETDPNIRKEDLIARNLTLMYRQMICGAKKTELFMGKPYRAGQQPSPGPGSIENSPHATVHNWTGQRQKFNEDMGNFFSAARDPVFFAHHGNVDRMWNVWRCLRASHTDFTDPDWLDTNFLFYDEEANLVRVRVRDCLDTAALGYTYQDVELKWLKSKPTKAGRAGTRVAPATGALPATMERTVRVTVGRPEISRSRFAKDAEEEVLIIEGIEIADSSRYVKFDVYVNEPEGRGVNVADAEFAGSVVLTPHREKGTIKTMAQFGISDLLDDIGADGSKTILVSLVPRSGGEVVTIRGVSISYVK